MTKKLTLKKSSEPEHKDDIPIRQVICGQVQKQELKAVPIRDLIPYKSNPRKNDNAVAALAKSLSEFGYVKNSILVDENMELLAGHTTLKAMISLGWDKVPEVTQVSGLTSAQKKGYRIADNKLGELAEWDPALLLAEIADLKMDGFDIALTGFDDKEIAELQSSVTPPAEEDDYEPPPEIETDIKRGEIYQLGRHRVMCGDSTSKEDVVRPMDGKKADAVITDVPYEISQKSNGLRNLDYGDWDKSGATGSAVSALSLCSEIPTITAFCGDEQLSLFLSKWENRTKRTLVWVKPNPTVINGEHVFLPACELAAHGRLAGAWFGGKCVRSVWEGAAPNKRDHPNQKPIDLIGWIVNLTCEKTAYDPFLGSGTTLIACEQLGRICYGMEISPQYCEVICQRWEKLTGKKREKVSA